MGPTGRGWDMKLYFDKRPFSWDAAYTVYEETGQVAYQVEGEPGEKENVIRLCNRNGVEIGRVRCRKTLFGKWRFSIWQDETQIGTVEKYKSHGVVRYELKCYHWRLFGNIMAYEYDIYDGKYMVVHAGNEDGAFPGKYVIDTSYSNNEQPALLVALAMEAANSTLPPRKPRQR